ncbi:MAG: methylhydantoinase [Rhizobiales bacterium 65-79]|nr:hydantoinase B/oxoprolinase family protein [Hyphomicrobiales bacterium]OJU05307.1 MAG: methylhydantoinase [Rhizobiales bacterium 65-79]
MTTQKRNTAKGFRCSFDIGGTFTDFILSNDDTGEIRIHKCLTVPSDPAKGALDGMADLLSQGGVEFSELREVVHGSTLVTNLVIERKGARTALLTTKGFRDIIEFGTEQRYDVHDLFLRFPGALVERSLRFEVNERMSRDGDVIEPIADEEIHRLLQQALDGGAKAVAVVFLHSYRNDAHERAVADYASRHFPQLQISISSEVCGEIREYERATTTTANAYAQPIVDPYVRKLEQELRNRGFTGELFLVQSSGALASPGMARRLPIRLLESGPAGGGLAAAHFGKTLGLHEVIAFDMGGTTAKVCLIRDGKPDIAPMIEAAREQRFRRGSGLPILAPVIDMIEIGAGGGSIAHHDDLGLIKVGPESSAADPGPACYGRGGKLPTVTDANLILGYLGADSFLGGRLKLDRPAAEAAYAKLADEDGISIERAAWGVFAVVCENMAGAARVHIVEKGQDPRNFTMIAFGGAGPAHAVRVAKALNVGRVVVPPASGAASALGFLGAPLAHEATRSAPCLVSELEVDATEVLLAELEEEGRSLLSTANIDGSKLRVRREADMRLSGQVHALRVEAPSDLRRGEALAILARNFAEAYRSLYAREPFGGELEVISWRVTTYSPTPKLRIGSLSSTRAADISTRKAWFPETNGYVETKVYNRYALHAGEVIQGPAIIEETESTTVVPPGDSFTLDANGNLVITLAAAKAAKAALTATTGDFDPIDLEIMWSRLVTISEECWQAVIRTAFSLIIGEAQDFACEILDENGDSLAHSPRAMPVFNITLMAAAKFLLKEYPIETLKPGDILMTNDPWHGSGHLFDIAVLTPVFHKGRVVAFLGSIGHVSDIGGTKNKSAVREIYEEGIQLPPTKLYAEGKPNRDVFNILYANLRNPRQVVGDIEALIAANALGAERLAALLVEYGLDDLRKLASTMHRLSENAAREAIRQMPDGVYSAITHLNGSGERLFIPAKVTVDGDSVEVDFEGCPPQVSLGGINNTLPGTQAETLFALKCILTPGIRATAGCYRAFTVKAPEGSILNCTHPAAVGLRRLTLFYVDAPILKALSEAVPDRMQAFTGLPTIIDLHGREASGRTFTDYMFVGGGQGGTARHDGKSGMLWPTSAANTSVEMIESRIPVVVIEKSLVADSGGAGRYRGGCGQRVRLRRLHDDNYPVFINVYPEGENVTTDGMLGGAPGGRTRAFRGSDGTAEPVEILEPLMIQVHSTNEIVEVQIGGGAGYGDPADRPQAEIQADILNGYVTKEGAKRYSRSNAARSKVLS